MRCAHLHISRMHACFANMLMISSPQFSQPRDLSCFHPIICEVKHTDISRDQRSSLANRSCCLPFILKGEGWKVTESTTALNSKSVGLLISRNPNRVHMQVVIGLGPASRSLSDHAPACKRSHWLRLHALLDGRGVYAAQSAIISYFKVNGRRTMNSNLF